MVLFCVTINTEVFELFGQQNRLSRASQRNSGRRQGIWLKNAISHIIMHRQRLEDTITMDTLSV